MSIVNAKKKIESRKVINYSNEISESIQDSQIYFADEDMYLSMFVAPVVISIKSLRGIFKVKDYYVGFSSFRELKKACNRMLTERFFHYSEELHHDELSYTHRMGSILAIHLNLLGKRDIVWGVSNDSDFTNATYQTIMRIGRVSKILKPPWLTSVGLTLDFIDGHQVKELIHHHVLEKITSS